MAIAAGRGVHRFEGDVLEANQAMLALAAKLGFADFAHSSEPGVLVVARDLSEPAGQLPYPARRDTAPLAYSA